MKNSDVEQYLRTEAEGFEMTPGPLVLERVMEALQKKEEKPKGVWLWLLLPVLLMAGTASLLYMFGRTDGNTAAQQQALLTLPPCAFTGYQNGMHVSQPVAEEHPAATFYPGGSQVVVHSHTFTAPVNITPAEHPGNTSSSSAGTDHSTAYTEPKKENTNEQPEEKTAPQDIHNRMHTNETKNWYIAPNISVMPQRPLRLLGVHFEQSVSSMLHSPYETTPDDHFIKLDKPRLFTPAPNKLYHWSIGAYLRMGATASHFDTSGTTSQGTATEYTSYRTQNDKFTFSYSTGITFRYQPLRFFAIETGVGFNNFTSREVVLDFTSSSADLHTFPDTTNALLNTSTGTPKEYLNAYSYVSIPLHLYFMRSWKWIGVEGGVGASLEIPVATASYEFDQTNDIMIMKHSVSSTALNNVGVTGEAKVHAMFHSGRLTFFIGPNFRYRFNSMFRSGYVIQQYPYFIGGETGIRVNF